MARPIKETVDYFPHFVKGGHTVFILESKYGNDGYAFWYKLLEILGDTEGHYYDCTKPNNWAYLLAKTRCDEDTARQIINTLLALDEIDGKLWQDKQVIWCQSFVDNVSSIYKYRHTEIPTPPTFSDEKSQGVRVITGENPINSEFSSKKPQENPINSELIQEETEEIEEKEKAIKEKEDKEDKEECSLKESAEGTKEIRNSATTIAVACPCPYEKIIFLWNSICQSFPKVEKLTEQRKGKIRCRFVELGSDLKAVEELFKRVQASPFLRGDSSRGWRANFDWLFSNGQNWVKVTEGNYDYREQPTTRRNGQKDSFLNVNDDWK